MNIPFVPSLSIILLTVFSHSIKAQFTEIALSSEVLFSEVTHEEFTSTGNRPYDPGDLNTWKYRGGIRLGTKYHIWKDRIYVKASLFYNERKALEFFPFPKRDSAASADFPSLATEIIFGQVPTSPQSEGYGVWSLPAIHFPNFKYLHLELLPIWQSRGESWNYEVGVGLNAGVLLNRAENTIDRSFLPWASDFFDRLDKAPYGEVKYHRYDLAWLAYLGLHYSISEQWKVGLTGRMSDSFIYLNDSFRGSGRHDVQWIVFTGGLEAVYKLK